MIMCFSLAQHIVKVRENSLRNEFVETLLSRNFCQKCVRCERVNFYIQFHGILFPLLQQCGKTRKLHLSNFFSANVVFTNFLTKKHEFNFPQFPQCAKNTSTDKEKNTYLYPVAIPMLLHQNP